MSDREFYKLFGGLLAGLVALTVILFVLAQMVASSGKPAKQAETDKAVAERIKPVGEVTIASSNPVMNALIPAAHAAGADKGKATYDASCAACHNAGVAGSPKLGDKADWGPRIAQGNDKLYQNAIKGFQGKKGFMPAKGGNAALKDEDVKAAVDFMVSKSK
jgi:cytochrome c5